MLKKTSGRFSDDPSAKKDRSTRGAMEERGDVDQQQHVRRA
jgi:hypothetical protein